MSDSFVRVVPTDPGLVPPDNAQREAADLMRSMLGGDADVTIEATEEIHFVDPGENMGEIHCPRCGAELSDFWPEAMGRAAETSFRDLSVQVPCCDSTLSLNELRYDEPVGFARFVLQAVNPPRGDLAPEDVAALEETLGTAVRVIHARY